MFFNMYIVLKKETTVKAKTEMERKYIINNKYFPVEQVVPANMSKIYKKLDAKDLFPSSVYVGPQSFPFVLITVK